MDCSLSNNPNRMQKINFKLIMKAMMQKKYVIISLLSVCLLAGLGYIKSIQPEYEARISLAPLNMGDFAKLHVDEHIFNINTSAQGNSGNPIISPRQTTVASLNNLINTVYAVFTDTLYAQNVRQAFYKQVILAPLGKSEFSHDDYKKMNSRIFIYADHKLGRPHFQIAIKDANPELAKKYVTEFLNIAQQQATKNMLRILNARNKSEAENIQERINAIKVRKEEERTVKLQKLNTALKIATDLGIERPSTDRIPDESYKNGIIILKAEIAALESQSITPSMHLQAKYDALTKPLQDTSNITLFHRDGEVMVSDTPVTPRSKPIMMVSLLIGLLLSSIIVLNHAAKMAQQHK